MFLALVGLVIPGGRSPGNLRQHEAIVQFARKLTEAGKPVAAICHGPQVLVTAGVLEGKDATCFAGMADELREAGASYTDAPMIRDENQTPPIWLPRWTIFHSRLLRNAEGLGYNQSLENKLWASG